MIEKLRKINFSNSAFLIASVAFILILIRGAVVPVSHDEGATFLHYIQRGDFFPFYAHWDANNHPLNSLLSIIMYKMVGDELIWLRMPNVLSFLLYARYGYLIFKGLNSKLAQSFGYLALLTAWMPFELFAQCRGYGLGLAFLIPAVYHLWRFLSSGKLGDQMAIWGFLILALSANLSLSNTYLIALLLVPTSLLIWHKKSNYVNLICYLIFGIGPFLAFTKVAFELKDRGLLYYGEDTGFLVVTVKTLVQYSFGSTAAVIIIGTALVGLVAGLFLLLDKKILVASSFDKGHLSSILLLGNVGGTLALNLFLGVNFPEDRVGIYFIPYFVLVVAFAAEKLKFLGQKPAHIVASLILLAFPICTLVNSSFAYTGIWRTLAFDRVLYERIYSYDFPPERPVIVSGYKLFPLSWSYENLKNNPPLPPLVHREFDKGISDFRVCYTDDCQLILDTYEDAFPDAKGEVRVFKRKQFSQFSVLKEYPVENKKTEGEYYNLLEEFAQDLIASADAIELRFNFKTKMNPALIDLVITAQNASGETTYYDTMPLHWIRHNWDSHRFEMIRPVNFGNDDTRIICYLWNRKKEEFELVDTQSKLLKSSG
ncbi:MAG: hypothetical protein AAGC47_02575 [Bacteroidota bacterium]